MKTASIDISTISFEEVIIHTLPKHKKDEKDIQPIFSETTSPLSVGLKHFFKEKIVSSLGSDKALRVVYDDTSLSPMSLLAKKIIVGEKKEFVENSKQVAKHLFDVQMGANNEGILVVISCTINSKSALISEL